MPHLDKETKDFILNMINALHENYGYAEEDASLESEKLNENTLSIIASYYEKNQITIFNEDKLTVDFTGLFAYIRNQINHPDANSTLEELEKFIAEYWIAQFKQRFKGIKSNYSSENVNPEAFYYFLKGCGLRLPENRKLINYTKDYNYKDQAQTNVLPLIPYDFTNLTTLIEAFAKSNFARTSVKNVTVSILDRLYLYIFCHLPEGASNERRLDLSLNSPFDVLNENEWGILKLKLLVKAIAHYKSDEADYTSLENFIKFFGESSHLSKIARYLDVSTDAENTDISYFSTYIATIKKILTKNKVGDNDQSIVLEGLIQLSDFFVESFLSSTKETENLHHLYRDYLVVAIHAGLIIRLTNYIDKLPNDMDKERFKAIVTILKISNPEEAATFGIFLPEYQEFHQSIAEETRNQPPFSFKIVADEEPKEKTEILKTTVAATATPASVAALTTFADKSDEPSFFKIHKRAFIGLGIGLGIAAGLLFLGAATIFTLGAIHIITAPALFTLLTTVAVPFALKWLTLPAATTATAEAIVMGTGAGSTAGITLALGGAGAAIGHRQDMKVAKAQKEEDKRAGAAASPAPSGDSSAQNSQTYTAPSP